MIKKPITIRISNGLEARPVAMLVQVASQYESEIYVESGKRKVNAKSIMGMMTLGLEKRSRLICTDNLPETPVYEADYEAAEWNQLLAPLDEKYRTILLLYYLEGFNTRQISEILEMKESTVKSRLQRGRKEAAKIYSGRYREGEA